MRRFLSILLTLAMLFSIAVPSIAAPATSTSQDDPLYLYFTSGIYTNSTFTPQESSSNRNIFIALNFENNPNDPNTTIQSYDVLIDYSKVSDKFTVNQIQGSTVHNLGGITPNKAFSDNILYVGWAATNMEPDQEINGIFDESQDEDFNTIRTIVTSGTFFYIHFQKSDNTAVSAEDVSSLLANLEIVKTPVTGEVTKNGKTTSNTVTTAFKHTVEPQSSVDWVALPSFTAALKDNATLYNTSTDEEIKNAITATYVAYTDSGVTSNVVTSDVTIASSTLNPSDTDNNKIVVEYSNLSYTIQGFNVTKDAITKLEVKTSPTLTYDTGENLDLSNLVITTTSAKGTKTDLTYDELVSANYSFTIDDTNNTEVNSDTTLTVAGYNGKTITVTAPSSLVNEGATVTATVGTLTVNPKSVTKPTASAAEPYTGELISFVNATSGDASYYTISGETSGTNAGTYTVTATLKDTSESSWADDTSGTLSIPWSIIAKEVPSATVNVSGTYIYTGSAIEPSSDKITVTDPDGGKTISPSEYSISYENNTNAGEATVNITDVASGNYTVTGNGKFKIDKADPTFSGSVEIKGWEYNSYNEDTNKPSGVTTNFGDVVYVYANDDGSFSYATKTASELNALDVGTYYVKARFPESGNVNAADQSGSGTAFNVTQATVSGDVTATVNAYYASSGENAVVYTGYPTTSGVTYTVVADSLSGNAKDYIATYTGSGVTLNAGNPSGSVGTTATYKVTVSSKNYVDTEATVTVNLINKKNVAISGISGETITYGDTYTPNPSVVVNGDTVTDGFTYKWTKDGNPYTESGSDVPTQAGTYALEVSYSDNIPDKDDPSIPGHMGTATMTLVIEQRVADLKWENTATREHDGNPSNVTASVTNIVPGDTVTVTVTGGDQTNASSTAYTATAESLSNTNYKLPDNATTTYTITPKKLDKPTLSETALTYNQKEQTVTASGYDSATMSDAGSVYKGTDVGTYTVKIALQNKTNYAWSDGSTDDLTLKWKINIASVAITEPTSISAVTYNGTQQKPDVGTVKAGDFTLTANDYEVVYGANVNAGTKAGTVTIHDTSSNFDFPDYTLKFDINKATQDAIHVKQNGTAITTLTATYKDDPISLTVDGGSGTDGTYTLAADPSSDVVTVSGENGNFTLTIHKAGSATLVAKKINVTNYEDQQTTVTVTVNKAEYATANGSVPTGTVYVNSAGESDRTYNIEEMGFSATDLLNPVVTFTAPDNTLVTAASSVDETTKYMLHLVTNAVDTSENEVSSALTLNISSNNYNTFSTTLTVTAKNITFDQWLPVSAFAYGTTNGDAVSGWDGETFYAKGDSATADIAGKLEIVNPDDIQDAGSGAITQKFTVTQDGAYNNISITKTFNVTINPLTAILTGTAEGKVYDGTTDVTTFDATVSGLLDRDSDISVTPGTATFGSPSVGEQTVTFSGFELNGARANCYVFDQPVSVTATITAKPITVSGIIVSGKAYDGTKTVSVDSSSATLNDIYTGDNDTAKLSVTVAETGELDSAEPGDRTATVSVSLTGTSAGNYTLPETVSIPVTITTAERALSVTPETVNLYPVNSNTGTVTLSWTDVDNDATPTITIGGSNTSAIRATISDKTVTFTGLQNGASIPVTISLPATSHYTADSVNVTVTSIPAPISGAKVISSNTADTLSAALSGYSITVTGTVSSRNNTITVLPDEDNYTGPTGDLTASYETSDSGNKLVIKRGDDVIAEYTVDTSAVTVASTPTPTTPTPTTTPSTGGNTGGDTGSTTPVTPTTPVPTTTPTPEPTTTPEIVDVSTKTETYTNADGTKVTTNTETTTAKIQNSDGTTTDAVTVKTESVLTADDGSSVATTKETVTRTTNNTVTNADGSVTDTNTVSTTDTQKVVTTDADGKATTKETVTESTVTESATSNTLSDGTVSTSVTTATKDSVKETTTDADGNVTSTETSTEKTKTDAKSERTEANGNVVANIQSSETTVVSEATTDANGNVTSTTKETVTESNISQTTSPNGDVKGSGTSSSTTTVKDENGNVISSESVRSDIDISTDAIGTQSTVTSSTVTTTDANGNTEVSQTVATDSVARNGSTGSKVEDADGNLLSADLRITEDAVNTSNQTKQPVVAPISVPPVRHDRGNRGSDYVAINLKMPAMMHDKNNDGIVSVAEIPRIEISVSITGPSIIAMVIGHDGSVTIIKESAMGSVIVPVAGDCELVIADNSKDFNDVLKDFWGVDEIQYVASREIFNGYGNNIFAPNDGMNRAMVAQVMYNFKRGAEAEDGSIFSDVSKNAWYNEAVGWAYKNDIVQGYGAEYGNEYGPNDLITRQDLATILYRYSTKDGYDTSSSADLSKFTDSDEISSYAQTAMKWAINKGLIQGFEDSSLRPKDAATRAQVAAIMSRFVENVV